MIGQLCDAPDAKDRVPGSLAAALVGVAQGVQIGACTTCAETKQAIEAAARVDGRTERVSVRKAVVVCACAVPYETARP